MYFLDVVDSVWTNNSMRVMAALQFDEWVASITTTEVQACFKSISVSISEVLLVSRIPNGGRIPNVCDLPPHLTSRPRLARNCGAAIPAH